MSTEPLPDAATPRVRMTTADLVHVIEIDRADGRTPEQIAADWNLDVDQLREYMTITDGLRDAANTLRTDLL